MLFLTIILSEQPSVNTEEASELLPEGWHQDHNIYQLQYVCDKKIYLVKGIVADNELIITIVVKITYFCVMPFHI